MRQERIHYQLLDQGGGRGHADCDARGSMSKRGAVERAEKRENEGLAGKVRDGLGDSRINELLEARGGIEPPNKGFADLFTVTDNPHQINSKASTTQENSQFLGSAPRCSQSSDNNLACAIRPLRTHDSKPELQSLAGPVSDLARDRNLGPKWSPTGK